MAEQLADAVEFTLGRGEIKLPKYDAGSITGAGDVLEYYQKVVTLNFGPLEYTSSPAYREGTVPSAMGSGTIRFAHDYKLGGDDEDWSAHTYTAYIEPGHFNDPWVPFVAVTHSQPQKHNAGSAKDKVTITLYGEEIFSDVVDAAADPSSLHESIIAFAVSVA